MNNVNNPIIDDYQPIVQEIDPIIDCQPSIQEIDPTIDCQPIVQEIDICPIPNEDCNVKLEISRTVNFYKGTSFRWVGHWLPGKTYANDEFNIDVVYHKGTSWVCVMSHISSVDTEPSEDSIYWNINVKQSGSGIHVGTNPPSESVYGDLAEYMLWLDTDEANQSMSVYTKAEVDEKLKPTVMSISEYEALENKEDKLYFLYEE